MTASRGVWAALIQSGVRRRSSVLSFTTSTGRLWNSDPNDVQQKCHHPIPLRRCRFLNNSAGKLGIIEIDTGTVIEKIRIGAWPQQGSSLLQRFWKQYFSTAVIVRISERQSKGKIELKLAARVHPDDSNDLHGEAPEIIGCWLQEGRKQKKG